MHRSTASRDSPVHSLLSMPQASLEMVGGWHQRRTVAAEALKIAALQKHTIASQVFGAVQIETEAKISIAQCFNIFINIWQCSILSFTFSAYRVNLR